MMAGTYVCAAGVSVHASVRVGGGLGGDRGVGGEESVAALDTSACLSVEHRPAPAPLNVSAPSHLFPPQVASKRSALVLLHGIYSCCLFIPHRRRRHPHPTQDAIHVTDQDYLNAKVLQTPDKKEKTSKPIKPSVLAEQEKEFDADQLVASRFQGNATSFCS